MASDLVPMAELLANLEAIRTGRLEGSTMRLFEGSHIPNIADSVGTYLSIETTFGGYAGQVLTGWTAAAMNGLVAYTNSPFATFSPNASPGSHVITGYFLVDSAGLLAGAGLLSGPITVVASVPFAVVAQRSLSN